MVAKVKSLLGGQNSEVKIQNTEIDYKGSDRSWRGPSLAVKIVFTMTKPPDKSVYVGTTAQKYKNGEWIPLVE